MKAVPCEVYSRVVGYFRPVQNWNEGKREEFRDRKAFNEEMSLNHSFERKAESKIEVPKTSVAEMIVAEAVKYKIFTLPTCCKCKDAKEFLSTTSMEGTAFDLSSNEGRGALRQYFNEIKDRIQRTEDGSLPIPLMLFFDSGNRIAGVATDIDSAKKFTKAEIVAA